jgi:hypothetical protein
MNAQQLHEAAQSLSDEGRDEEALRKYEEALQLDPSRSSSWYNSGLIYKYRKDWSNSYRCNLQAYTLAPDDEASRWNLAIAATALRDWKTARSAWADNGIELEGTEGPINMDFGPTPVRLNPDGDAEVVWAERIDPVRAVLRSIPFPDSGFRCGDIVLHDGAGVGTRTSGGRQYMVFNVFELFEASRLSTYCMVVDGATAKIMQLLENAFAAADLPFEDWTSNVRTLCRACSEGSPHQHCDQEGGEKTDWNPERTVGIAALTYESITVVLDKVPGIEDMDISISLELAA